MGAGIIIGMGFPGETHGEPEELPPRHETGVLNAASLRVLPLATAELQEALTRARIQTLYQPVIRFRDRHPVGLEVLARLDHPARGLLDPDQFVPPMEDAGLSWALTEAVVARAFAEWGGDRLASLDLTLALNIPLDVLLIPEALARLDTARVKAGIAAHRLVLELTESRPVIRLPELHMIALRLRALGYGLAIDDAGPAVRDHSALLGLPFTMLKLDKEVVQDAPDDDAAHDFLVGAIAAARRAGLTVTAEGVESEAIWTHMQGLGVDLAQGFLISRPLPTAAVSAWRHDWCARARS